MSTVRRPPPSLVRKARLHVPRRHQWNWPQEIGPVTEMGCVANKLYRKEMSVLFDRAPLTGCLSPGQAHGISLLEHLN